MTYSEVFICPKCELENEMTFDAIDEIEDTCECECGNVFPIDALEVAENMIGTLTDRAMDYMEDRKYE